jgi:hypothetical protein
MENTQPSRGPTPRVRVSSPADVLAVVPHLLGFHPSRSMVVIGASGPRERIKLGFRYDLPDPPGKAAAADIAAHAVTVLGHQRITTVIGVGYGPGTLVTPVCDALAAAVRKGGLRLRELMRVEDGRYWSYLCRDVNCCPAQGVAFTLASHPASAVMSAAGLGALPDRETLASTLAPVTGALAQAMDQAAQRACDRAAKLTARAGRRGGADPMRPVIDAGRQAVRDAISLYRGGGRITDDDQHAWLLITLVHLAVRDDAWARMEPAHREAHLRLWTDLVRRADAARVPGPAALLAFTAWQCGEGALANIAIDRALAADPGYSMALLLRDVIDAGVPPSAARVPMSPEEVEESYAKDPGTGPRHRGLEGREGLGERGRRGGRGGRGRRGGHGDEAGDQA